jgi:molybdate-binding protein/DNA-binding XRE family transcriptional regulator
VSAKIQNNVASVRASRGLTAAELAKRIGVIRQTIYAVEAGTYVPNTEVALRIAQELEVTVEDLFTLPARGKSDTGLFRAEYLSTGKPEKGRPVQTGRVGSTWVSVPVSAAPYHLPEADGVIAEIDRAGSPKVHVFSQETSNSKRLIVAGCDPAASLLTRMVEKLGGVDIVHAPATSRVALEWLRAGTVHFAGCHLEDPKTGEFNLPFVHREFPKKDVAVITFAEWEAGLVVASGNPKSIRKIEDLARKNVQFVNRETGSGSRALLDKLLLDAQLSKRSVKGYERIVAGHLAAAYAVYAKDADCCLATQSAAQAYGLDFIPLHRERYDFVLRRETLELPNAQAFLDVLQRAALRRKLESLAGYDTTRMGAIVD